MGDRLGMILEGVVDRGDTLFSDQEQTVSTNLPNRSSYRVVRPFLPWCLGVGLSAILVLVPSTVTPEFDGTWPQYTKQELLRAVHWYARQYRVDPVLLRAVIKAESNFDPAAVSDKGAIGLMQLMPSTAASLKVHEPFNPIDNIRGGAKQLRHLLTRYKGDWRLSLAAYNAGVHRVQGKRMPRIRETRAYVRKVLRYYREFKRDERRLARTHAASQPAMHRLAHPSKSDSKSGSRRH